jgi:hypothetical protein
LLAFTIEVVAEDLDPWNTPEVFLLLASEALGVLEQQEALATVLEIKSMKARLSRSISVEKPFVGVEK